MKIIKVIIATIVVLTFAKLSTAGEDNNDISKLLQSLDLRHPIYGNKIYGEPKINKFVTADGSQLLSYQARYGGDGDHSENILKLFLVTGSTSKKILDQNIDKVKFIVVNNQLKSIKGEYIETLCNVCDGWEVSEQNDVFVIPILIDVETLKIMVELSQAQKNELLKRLDTQINKNISEKSSYKFGQTSSIDEKYVKYAESVKRRIVNLLKN
jgi:hypothetical protein